ncbi:hypothetical protein HC031_02450 [Planosporangium thailandense]|uniref:Uncharacterized protein n=1 Tax=Planosporangium thailandense TaxID=765197 RepID=A0ABX0XTH1_9ACTN|nr:protealysin inhibitor emfourin [Planosporangium thailandense]NJC68589.1 hypothetical protein [Planosporangium thailandense]
MICIRIRAVPVGLLLFTLAACAGTNGGRAPAADPTGSAVQPTNSASSPAAPDTRVVVVRSGGLAGIRDTITVEPQGQWTRVDSAGNQHTGRLTDDDRNRLRALVGAPGLRAEAGAAATTTRCRDAYLYSLTVGSTHVSYADCPGDANRPQSAASIVGLLLKATG